MRHLVRSVVLLVLAASPALAQWQSNGALVCGTAGTGYKLGLAAVADGTGGVIVLWNDDRIGRRHIWMQHLDAAGNRLWAADGIPLQILNGELGGVYAVSDGTGGVIVATTVQVDAQFHTVLYAQRMSGSGVALWNIDGVEVVSQSSFQRVGGIVSDGLRDPFFGSTPGAIITWGDYRYNQWHIYAQNIDNAGNRLWGQGISCSDRQVDEFTYPMICTDRIGKSVIRKGSYVLWRDPFRWDIMGQHMQAGGGAVWGDSARWLTEGAIPQGKAIATTNPGRFMFAWNGYPGIIYDINVQRGGEAGPWTSPTTLTPSTVMDRGTLAMVPDDSAGAIVAWAEGPLNSGTADLWMQRVDENGAKHWPGQGIVVCTAPGTRVGPKMINDGNHGALLVWQDARDDANWDLYAQHIDQNGQRLWDPQGVPVCIAPRIQDAPQVVSDGAGGAIAVWVDDRAGLSTNAIYAQKISATGAVVAAETQVAPPTFALRAAYPNPTTSSVTLDFELPALLPVHADVFTADGRRVRCLIDGRELPAGRQSLRWDGLDASRERAPVGVYFLRVQAGATAQVRRVAVVD